MGRPRNFTKSARRMKMIEDALTDKALMARELAPKVFVTKNTVQVFLTNLHSQGKIHIESWVRCKGGPIRKYKWGRGKDVARPKRFTPAEYSQQERNRLKADPEALERFNAKRRARTIKPKRTADIAALFGEPT
jgi:predicted ArsR family transcriptional regulator